MVKILKKISLLYLLAGCLLLLTWPQQVSAITAEDKYYQAEACYQKLRSSSKRQKYRDQWLLCIEKFQEVYRIDPTGRWAPAGLYMSGELYQKLYDLSYKASDKREALDIFERIIKRFPRSQYRQKAAAAIRTFGKPPSSKGVSTKVIPPQDRSDKAQKARHQYAVAEKCYHKLLKSTRSQKYRDRWLICIEKFQDVYRIDPSGPWAAAGLYMSGQLYQELYKRSFKTSDKKEALDSFQRIIKRFPQSQYRPKAADAMDSLSQTASPKVAARQKGPVKSEPEPAADKIAREIEQAALTPVPAVKSVAPPDGQNATVKGLRYWSNPSYTRIVIDADSEADYTHRLLKKDPSIHKPQRLYVDLDRCRLGEDITKMIPINDNLLSDVRAGQNTSDSVRVVVDIKSFKTYKIFSLKNPFRIVIDVWGKEPKPTRRVARTDPQTTKLPPGSLAKQLALGVSRIVIDPGHGGRDYGAPGYLKGVHEKDIVLKVARRLAKMIRAKLHCEVFLTRNSDRHLTLEERTAIANTKNADLFISIHTNAARDRRAYGIETYFLNLATDEDAIMVAARENATSTKNISDLQTILTDLMQNAKINESSRLAMHVQENMYKHLRKKYRRINNKGVKQAPFYVLLGAQMPAILIETAFISNSRECKRLVNVKYQDQMCEAIINGIQKYIKETTPTAFFKSPPQSGSKG